MFGRLDEKVNQVSQNREHHAPSAVRSGQHGVLQQRSSQFGQSHRTSLSQADSPNTSHWRRCYVSKSESTDATPLNDRQRNDHQLYSRVASFRKPQQHHLCRTNTNRHLSMSKIRSSLARQQRAGPHLHSKQMRRPRSPLQNEKRRAMGAPIRPWTSQYVATGNKRRKGAPQPSP